jgi:hypothetical protein
VDIIVDYAKEMILQKHNDRIKIPDIREGFEKKVKYSNIYPTRCNITQFILSGNCSTSFGW